MMCFCWQPLPPIYWCFKWCLQIFPIGKTVFFLYLELFWHRNLAHLWTWFEELRVLLCLYIPLIKYGWSMTLFWITGLTYQLATMVVLRPSWFLGLQYIDQVDRFDLMKVRNSSTTSLLMPVEFWGRLLLGTLILTEQSVRFWFFPLQ